MSSTLHLVMALANENYPLNTISCQNPLSSN